jgi:hypothetical protein
MIGKVRQIKIVSQSDAERAEIELLVRRHETALLRALRRYHRRFPKQAAAATESLSRKVLLTSETRLTYIHDESGEISRNE